LNPELISRTPEDALNLHPDGTFDCIVTDPFSCETGMHDPELVFLSDEALRECCRVLKLGAFAFFVTEVRQDILTGTIAGLEKAGFRIGMSGIYWIYPGEEGRAGHAIRGVVVVMKPLSEKTYVERALKNGKGVTWLEECRVPYWDEVDKDDSCKERKKGEFIDCHLTRAQLLDLQEKIENHLAVFP